MVFTQLCALPVAILWAITWETIANQWLYKHYNATVSCSDILTLFKCNYLPAQHKKNFSITLKTFCPLDSVYPYFLPSHCPDFILILLQASFKRIHVLSLSLVLHNKVWCSTFGSQICEPINSHGATCKSAKCRRPSLEVCQLWTDVATWQCNMEVQQGCLQETWTHKLCRYKGVTQRFVGTDNYMLMKMLFHFC